MKHEDIKLQCLSIANGNLEVAKKMFAWLIENQPCEALPMETRGSATGSTPIPEWMKQGI